MKTLFVLHSGTYIPLTKVRTWMTIEKRVKICFTSSINKEKTKNGPTVWRSWKVKVRPCEKVPLGVYIDHVEYTLHESFETPRIVCYEEPYLVQQDGWGEFELKITFYYLDQETPPETVLFDLNFLKPNYSEYKTLHLAESNQSLKSLTSLFNTTKRGKKRDLLTDPDTFSASVQHYCDDNNNTKRHRTTLSASASCSPTVTTPCLDDPLLLLYLNDTQQQEQQKSSISLKEQAEQEKPHQIITPSEILSSISYTQHQQEQEEQHYSCDGLSMLNSVIPDKEIDMSLLATNLESLNDNNLRKIYDIIFFQDQSIEAIPFIETKDHVMFDLYSLDNLILNQLWDTTTHQIKVQQQDEKEEQQQQE